jgi:DtxR family Mn-dependent transcriptional regulator
VISDDVEEKLIALLGDPVTCPHGNPIPGSRRTNTSAPSVRLLDAELGQVTVARISEKLELNDDSLRLIAAARLIPGASAEVVGKQDGNVQVLTTAGETSVPGDVAAQMFVAVGT